MKNAIGEILRSEESPQLATSEENQPANGGDRPGKALRERKRQLSEKSDGMENESPLTAINPLAFNQPGIGSTLSELAAKRMSGRKSGE